MSQGKRMQRWGTVWRPAPALKELLVSVVLALLTLLVYWPSLYNLFVNYDDPAYVFENLHVQTGLTADSVRWAFTTFDCGNWHPLTWLSLQLDSQCYGGLSAAGFHLTNVLLHTANTLLVFIVLGRLTGLVWRSAVVAALFALHPLHVESVAWVAERKDVLSTLFWMLTLAAYLHYVRRPSMRRYLLVVLALALGLLAKPMLVTLPFVLLLLDYWPLGRLQIAGKSTLCTLHSVILEKLPLFVLVLASCAVTFFAQLQGKTVASLETFPLTARVSNALLAYVGYLGKMLWPMHLALYYPHPGPTVSATQALAAGMLLVAITVLVLGPGRRWPYLAVGWLWYLGTLVPVIGLVQVGRQAMADRYTYVPLIGLFLLLTWGVSDLVEARGAARAEPHPLRSALRAPRLCLIAITTVVLCACAVLTWVQVGYWQSTLQLWKHAATVTENNALAHMNLGTCYYKQGMISDAKREFEKAVTIDAQQVEPHVGLGIVLSDIGLWEAAVAEYRKAIDLDPERAVPHFSLGNALQRLGRLEEALAEYRRAIALDVNYAPAHNNLGIVLVELGQPDEGIAEFRRAIALDPDNAGPHDNLGAALQEAGRLEEALTQYHEALELGDKQARPRLQACQRLLALRPRLPGVIAGRDQPADNSERLAFADLCRQPCQRHYAPAARLYAEAFNLDPKLADVLQAANRFHAASAAAAAGCGQGQDAGLDEKEKTRLRRQALNWLRAELDVWTRQAQSDTQGRATAGQALRTWQRSASLTGVHDPAALAKLTEAERHAWQKLWQDVDAALAKASSPPRQP